MTTNLIMENLKIISKHKKKDIYQVTYIERNEKGNKKTITKHISGDALKKWQNK